MQEGVRGFSAGVGQRSLYISLGSALFFSVFEAVHHRLADRHRDDQARAAPPAAHAAAAGQAEPGE